MVSFRSFTEGITYMKINEIDKQLRMNNNKNTAYDRICGFSFSFLFFLLCYVIINLLVDICWKKHIIFHLYDWDTFLLLIPWVLLFLTGLRYRRFMNGIGYFLIISFLFFSIRYWILCVIGNLSV